jgi:hypothetical protein
MYLFLLTFFGLTLEYRPILFKQIHDIVFHGNGGYDWDTVYNMPIWLRRTTFNIIKEYHDKQNEDIENQQKTLQNKNNKDIARPNITPNYTAKVPKK